MSQQQPDAIYDLPWACPRNEEKRFRLIVAIVMALAISMSLLLQTIDIPKLEREDAEAIPPRLAKMILEKKKVEPPPPPPVELEKPKPEELVPEPKPEEKKPEPKPQEKKPEPKPEPKPVEKSKKDIEAARKKAASSGVLAMRDMLADLREAQPIENLNKKSLQTGGSEQATKSRSILAANASRGSGGIDTSKFGRSTSGAELQGHESAAFEDVIANVDENALAEGGGGEPGKLTARTDGEIQKTFDANKPGIFSLYQRELRKNPLLQGKVVFRITILPSGIVEEVEIVSSELNHAKLERKLVLKIKQIDFGAKNVDTTTVTYPIDFLPNL